MMNSIQSKPLGMHEYSIILCVIASFVCIGYLDHISGTEIRIFPLYFLPICLTAWRLGDIATALSVLVATAIWFIANYFTLSGQAISFNIMIINTFSQFIAFGSVSALLRWARVLLNRERELSSTDSLTGLANSRAFYASTENIIAFCKRKKKPLTLAYIDLDNFKSVNDKYGHKQGDHQLKSVAKSLKTTLRATDIIARLGGDEFIVCLPETSQTQASILLNRLHQVLKESIILDGLAFSASIGAICWEEPPEDIDNMISTADKIMYQAKKNGKNRVEIISVTAN